MAKNPPNKALTDKQVLDIRTEYAKGKKGYNYFAKLYGISKPTARSMILGLTYKHVPNPCAALNPNAMSDEDIRARQKAAIVASRKEKRMLTTEQVVEMRMLFRTRVRNRLTMKEIASKYGLAVASAYYAIIGRTYTDVPHAVDPDKENLRVPCRYTAPKTPKPPKQKAARVLPRVPQEVVTKPILPADATVLSKSEVLSRLLSRRK